MALQVKDFSVTAKSGHGKITYTYIIRVTEHSIDPVKNCSRVTVEAILKQTFSGTAFSGYRTGVSCDVNGRNLFSDYCRRTIAGKAEHVFYTWNGEMPHDNDGTLTLQLSGKLWQTKPADYTPPTMQIPQEQMELTPIMRASQVGAADACIGSRTTVVITPSDLAFAHTLSYTFGQESGYISQYGGIVSEPVLLTGTTVSFELPERFYTQIPDQPSALCKLVCTTYDSAACIGTSETTFRVSIDPVRCWPAVQFTAEDINPKTLALTADPQMLIRHMSRLKITLKAQGAYGAWITQKTVNTKPLEGEELEIDQVQSGEVKTRVTDSRGNTLRMERFLPMIPYIKLTNHAAVSRTSPTGDQAVLTFSGCCYRGSLGKVNNTLRLRYRLCPEGGVFGQWQELEALADYDHTYRLETTVTGLDYTKTYTLQTQAVDALDEAECSLSILPGIPVYHWNKERFFFHVPVEFDGSVSGAYIRSYPLSGQDRIRLTVTPGQTVFLFGADAAVCGAAGSSGQWWGSPNVTAEVTDDSLTLLLPQGCGGDLLLISPQPIYIE